MRVHTNAIALLCHIFCMKSSRKKSTNPTRKSEVMLMHFLLLPRGGKRPGECSDCKKGFLFSASPSPPGRPAKWWVSECANHAKNGPGFMASRNVVVVGEELLWWFGEWHNSGLVTARRRGKRTVRCRLMSMRKLMGNLITEHLWKKSIS